MLSRPLQTTLGVFVIIKGARCWSLRVQKETKSPAREPVSSNDLTFLLVVVLACDKEEREASTKLLFGFVVHMVLVMSSGLGTYFEDEAVDPAVDREGSFGKSSKGIASVSGYILHKEDL